MKAFLSLVSCRQDSSFHDLPWVPKDRSEQLLIKGEAAKKPLEARLKGRGRLIKIRRLDHLRLCIHTNLISNPNLLKLCRRKRNARLLLLPWSLSHTLAWLITSPYSPESGGTVLETLAYCVPPLPGKVTKPLFPSPLKKQTNKQKKTTKNWIQIHNTPEIIRLYNRYYVILKKKKASKV